MIVSMDVDPPFWEVLQSFASASAIRTLCFQIYSETTILLNTFAWLHAIRFDYRLVTDWRVALDACAVVDKKSYRRLAVTLDDLHHVTRSFHAPESLGRRPAAWASNAKNSSHCLQSKAKIGSAEVAARTDISAIIRINGANVTPQPVQQLLFSRIAAVRWQSNPRKRDRNIAGKFLAQLKFSAATRECAFHFQQDNIRCILKAVLCFSSTGSNLIAVAEVNMFAF